MVKSERVLGETSVKVKLVVLISFQKVGRRSAKSVEELKTEFAEYAI